MINKFRAIKYALMNFVYSEEEVFYYRLFTKNSEWNNRTPNDDEALRWTYIKALIDKYLKIKKASILDLGCGRGWLTNLLSQYGSSLGIEPVNAVVRYAKELYPNLSFRHGTADILIKDEIKFDLIVCSEVIEHIQDANKPKFADDLYKLLNNGALLIITTPRKEYLSEGKSASEQPVEEWLSEKEITQTFKTSKFEALEVVRFGTENSAGELVYQAWIFRKIL